MASYRNSSFKNLEWLQYIITRKIEEFYKQKKQEEKNKISEISIPIFSLIGAYSITEVTTIKGLNYKQIIMYLSAPFIFLLLCYIGKKIKNSDCSERLIEYYKKGKIYSVSTDEVECKLKIKEFNNIICNNILLNYAFIDKYEENDNINVKMYYFNEIQHYLSEAISKLDCIINSDFINKIFIVDLPSENKTKSIRIDRVDNIIKMIEDNFHFLDSEKGNFQNYSEINVFCTELEVMKIDFDNIKSGYNKYIES